MFLILDELEPDQSLDGDEKSENNKGGDGENDKHYVLLDETRSKERLTLAVEKTKTMINRLLQNRIENG